MRYVFGLVVHVVVSRSFHHEEVFFVSRQFEQPLTILKGTGDTASTADNDLQGLRQQFRHQVKSVEAENRRKARKIEAVGRIVVSPAGLAIERHRIKHVPVGDPSSFGLLQTVWNPAVAPLVCPARLGRPLPTDRLKRLDDLRDRLHLTECAAHIGGDDSADGLETMLGQGRVHRISTAGADAQHADPVLADIGQRHQEIDGATDVLDAGRRVFQIAGLATAFPLVGRVEHQRNEPLCRKPRSVDRPDLLLDAASGGGDDNRGVGPALVKPIREVEMSREIDGSIFERHALQFTGHCAIVSIANRRTSEVQYKDSSYMEHVSASQAAIDVVSAARVWRLTFQFSAEVLNEAAAEIEALGLEPKEFFVLDGIEERPYPAELARYLSMPKPTVTLYLKSLQAKAFIARGIDPHDLRRHRLELTAAGFETITKARDVLAARYSLRLDRLSTGEQDQFTRLLEKLAG